MRACRVACPEVRMKRNRRARCWMGLPAAALVFLVAACSEGPRPPLLSPIEASHEYGYADKSAGDDRLVVTYTGPLRQTSTIPERRDADAQAARNQAVDFAIWHAAQIAQAQGYEGFRVTDKRTDVDAYSDPGYDSGPFCSPFGTNVDAFGVYHGGALGYGSPGCYPPSLYARLRARASIEVTLLHAPEAGDYRTADTMAQLQSTYPGADRNPYTE